MSELTAPKVSVLLAGREDHIELQCANPDMVRWDLTASKEGWPSLEVAPMLWMTFLAWSAARRLGIYEGKWLEWAEKDCLDIDADVEVVASDPTKPGVEPGSASS